MKKLTFIFILLILGSCKTWNNTTRNKNKDKKEKENSLNYMQNIKQVAIEQSKNIQHKLKNGDQLLILISAKDKDVASPFNQNYSSSQSIQNSSTPGGNTLPSRETETGPLYTVDANGNISIPYLGDLNVIGKTLEDFKEELKRKLEYYIKDPTVNIKLTNYIVSVMGEVKNPGQYTISNYSDVTILNVLSMAGDLTIHGRRDEVLVVRNNSGETLHQTINLQDANFINSPYYYIRQGDVIYIPANRSQEKLSRSDPNTGIYIGVASIIVTILALILKK